MSDDEAHVRLDQLPDEVRLRVLGLTADVLPQVPALPAPLRKVADFAPVRRARLGATVIGAALADDEFRGRVAVQVESRIPSPREDLGRPSPGADPAELAALSWLLRPEGWRGVLEGALAALRVRAGGTPEGAADVERWRTKVEALEQALREARTRHRAELSELKADNTQLRRKLGEARTRLRDAVEAAEVATAALDDARRQDQGTLTAQEREIRQLRARIEQLEADALADRRSARANRDDATIRARLLLDTVIDAASGLRRELSLPSVAGSPGDRVEAELAEEGTRSPSSAGAMGPSSPALLEQYLAMPRARLIIDGYNVSKSAWPSSSLEEQRTRLLNGLAPVVARTGAETTVVFDAAATTHRPVVASPRGVKVRFSPEGVIADDVVRDLVAAEPEGRVVLVVTDDGELRDDVVRRGARVVPGSALLSLLKGGGV